MIFSIYIIDQTVKIGSNMSCIEYSNVNKTCGVVGEHIVENSKIIVTNGGYVGYKGVVIKCKLHYTIILENGVHVQKAGNEIKLID